MLCYYWRKISEFTREVWADGQRLYVTVMGADSIVTLLIYDRLITFSQLNLYGEGAVGVN